MSAALDRTLRSSFYSRLGVHRSSTPIEIKEAWKRESRKAHPDAHCSETLTDVEKEVLNRLFEGLSEAYSVLKSPTRRKAYDRVIDATGDECGACKGKGFVAKTKGFTVRLVTPCDACLRTGRVLRENCPEPEKEVRA